MDDKEVNITQGEIDSSPKKELSKGGLNTIIGCGALVLICNIAAGMVFWKGWIVWLIFGFIGYFFLWAGLNTRFPKHSRLVYAFLALLNLSLMYFGNLLVDRANMTDPGASSIVNGIFGYLFVLCILLFLVPWNWNNFRIIVAVVWTGICVFAISYILNHWYPGVWAIWLLIDLIGLLAFLVAAIQASESLGYKDQLLNQLAFGNLFVLWATLSWAIYPERLWLWVILTIIGILVLIPTLENWLRTKKDISRYRSLYIINYLLVLLPPLWVAARTWGGLIPIIIVVCYILLILAMRQSHASDAEKQNFKFDVRTWLVFYFYVGIACMAASVIWYIALPKQANNAVWLGFGGFFAVYASLLQQSKAQHRIFPLWIDLTSGVLGLSILFFGWNNPSISRVWIVVVGYVAAGCLERLGANLKKSGRSPFFAIIIGIFLFASGMWIGQNFSNAYGLQILLGFEGVWVLLTGIANPKWNDGLINLYPGYATLAFFICMMGAFACMPYIFKAAWEQQTLDYNILWSAITYALLFYPTTYLKKVVPETFRLIIEEVLPDKKVRDKITVRFNIMGNGA